MKALLLWLHLIGVTFWVGGILVSMLVLMPSLKAISPAERGKMMGAFVKRFAPLAWGAIALIVVTGLILTNRIIGFSTLVSFNTRFGNILLAKIILVTVMILNGAYLGFVLGPKIASFAPPPGAPEPAGSGKEDRPAGPPPELLRVQRRMTTLMWVQVGLAVAVFLLIALL
ncbi:MAG: CopD family protein [Candidatus Binatia bacterium]